MVAQAAETGKAKRLAPAVASVIQQTGVSEMALNGIVHNNAAIAVIAAETGVTLNTLSVPELRVIVKSIADKRGMTVYHPGSAPGAETVSETVPETTARAPETTGEREAAKPPVGAVEFADGTRVTEHEYFAHEGDTEETRRAWANLKATPKAMRTASTRADFASGPHAAEFRVVGRRRLTPEDEAKRIVNNLQEGEEHGDNVPNRTERDNGEGAGEQTEQLDRSGTRETAERSGERSGAESGQENIPRLGAERLNSAQLAFLTADMEDGVSGRQLGIPGATNSKTLELILPDDFTREMQANADMVWAELGATVYYVRGSIECRADNGKTFYARGVLSEDGMTIWVQVDDRGATFEQITQHEMYHVYSRLDDSLNNKAEAEILRHYKGREDEYYATMQGYIDAYKGVIDIPANATYAVRKAAENEIREEMLADAYAGISAFGEHAEKYRSVVKQTVWQKADETVENSTGPPPETEKAKEDITNDRRNGIAFSTKRTIDRPWTDQLKNHRHDDTLVAQTYTDTFLEGIKNEPMAVPVSVITKAQSGKDASHSISDKNIARFPDGMKNAPIVIDNPARNSIVYITDIEDGGGLVIVSFLKDQTFDGDRVHKATSVHVRTDPVQMLEKLGSDATTYVRKNKLGAVPGSSLLKSGTLDTNIKFIDDTVAYIPEKSNSKFSANTDDGIDFLDNRPKFLGAVEDSKGRKLTQAQAEYFRDSKAVDDKGNLLVMYHLSDANDISIFQSGNSAGLIYFAPNEKAAKKAARGTKSKYECYLNVERPVNTEDTPLNWYEAEDSLRVGEWRRKGYDGVYVRDEAGVSLAVFSPEQIKRTDNRNPTGNPDIRYSLKRTGNIQRDMRAPEEENDPTNGETVTWAKEESDEASNEAPEIKESTSAGNNNVSQEQAAPLDTDDGAAFLDNRPKFSRAVEDRKTLDFLNGQDTVTTYKTMQLRDGKLYPPMAARIDGEYVDASELGRWEEAAERPDLIKNGKFKLDKGKGSGSIEAAYNPYMHSSNLVLNDQFTGAHSRDNLVTVECAVPESEATSGYHAKHAKDAVVASETVPTNLPNKDTAAKWVADKLQPTGYRVDKQDYGEIFFSKKDIDKGLRYSDTPEEKAALAVLPQVLKKGIWIGEHNRHKGRTKQTITFAAPVELNGTRGNMAVVVNRNGNHYYAHRIVLPDGTAFRFSDEKSDDDQEHFSELFSPDFFDLIIVDECHRGSAKEESRWRRILDYFRSATQIGMTATPKETKYISNLSYFGNPVYTYSLKQGIEDGFLAPFKVIRIMTDIGDGWRPRKGQLDINGMEIPDRIYTDSDYDYSIVIEDRIQQVAKEITQYLKSTDRMAKTIVFCATEDAAERMRQALVNLNSDMVKEHPDYVVRITGSDVYGKSKLDYFISVSAKYPVIATTSKLLSTGADCKMTKLIVLDEMIGSMTEFKQIIGRGTRIREKEGKTHFVVMDFRNVTRLFADPDWDGPIEIDPGFTPGGSKPPEGPTDDPVEPPVDPKQKPIVDKNGCKVEIIHKTVSVYDVDGKLLRQESIIDYTKENIRGEYASLDNFIRRWTAEEKKEKIRELFLERGIDLEAMKADQNMTDLDDFDFICHVAFDKTLL